MAQEPATEKITYATLSTPSEALHTQYEAALDRQRNVLGREHPMLIGGRQVKAAHQFEVRSPNDTRIIVGHFQRATTEHVEQAVAAARRASRDWAGTDWRERVRIITRAADLISERAYDIAAQMSLEVGKTRLEALGDVEESADFLRYYGQHMQSAEGFQQSMGALGPGERNRDLLRPYGVWLVISPFNFPLALAAGPVGAALVSGNTVILKPSSDAPSASLELGRLLLDAGVPDGAISVLTGSGEELGVPLSGHPDIGGLTFTGSYATGMELYRAFTHSSPRPCIAEMGGKNPAIVTRHADLEKAAEGVVRSAFGYSGQKCSACSRVYVDRNVKADFIDLLRQKTEPLKVGDPTQRGTFTGPVIRRSKVEDFQRAIDLSLSDGRMVTGGRVIDDGDLAHGHFVQLTAVEGLPHEHPLMRQEHFMPYVGIVEVDSVDQALDRANDTIYGLTAGIYSEDEGEIAQFLDRIEAGVVYVNRRAGATTGAWPGVQAFGGWKGSGSTGRGSGGPYYLPQYLREQSQSIIE